LRKGERQSIDPVSQQLKDPLTKCLQERPRKFDHGTNIRKSEFGPQVDFKHGAAPGFEFMPSSMAYGHFPDYSKLAHGR